MNFVVGDNIRQNISIESVMNAIENFFLNTDTKSTVILPERTHVEDDENTVLFMPAFSSNYYSSKIVTIAPHNTVKNKSVLQGLLILNDRKTLEPLAIYDAQSITALRTGAIGGISIRHLAPSDASSVGIIGTGEQGWSHLVAACSVRLIKKVYVHNRSEKRLIEFERKVNEFNPTIEVIKADPKEITELADIVITTTTSKTPVFPFVDINKTGMKHLVAVGSFRPDMQEIPDSILTSTNHLFVDTLTAFKESGDMIRAKQLGMSNVKTLEDLICAKDKTLKEQFTIFKSVGSAIFDLVTAQLIYEKGIK